MNAIAKWLLMFCQPIDVLATAWLIWTNQAYELNPQLIFWFSSIASIFVLALIKLSLAGFIVLASARTKTLRFAVTSTALIYVFVVGRSLSAII